MAGVRRRQRERTSMHRSEGFLIFRSHVRYPRCHVRGMRPGGCICGERCPSGPSGVRPALPDAEAAADGHRRRVRGRVLRRQRDLQRHRAAVAGAARRARRSAVTFASRWRAPRPLSVRDKRADRDEARTRSRAAATRVSSPPPVTRSSMSTGPTALRRRSLSAARSKPRPRPRSHRRRRPCPDADHPAHERECSTEP
jgi:hypothetical protein